MRNLNQTGAVSLLSTMIFATIVTVLITAYMMTALSQQRQATTHDFSTRAYYTAESGVQDAIRALNTGEAPDDSNCSPIGVSDGTVGVSGVNLAYTCQLVTEGVDGAPGIAADLETNKTTMIRLSPEDRNLSWPYRLVIRWSPIGEGRYTRATRPIFPRSSAWYSGGQADQPIHSLLRVSVISHPQTGLNRGNIRQRVAFLNPTSGTDSGVQPDVPAGQLVFQSSDSLGVQQANLINHAECYNPTSGSRPAGHSAGSTTYSCRRTIELDSGYNFTNQEIYIRISPFYRSTRMYLELQDASGVPVSLVGGQATIDVTAKAGNNVFRRVKQVVNIGGNVTVDDGPDAAVIVAEGICKHFAVGLQPSDFVSGDCNPSTEP